MLCVRDDTRVAGHGSCNGRGAVVSCGGISAPFWVRFGGRGTGFFELAKSEKSAGVAENYTLHIESPYAA